MVGNYEKIKAKLELKHAPVIEMEPPETGLYIGWTCHSFNDWFPVQ
jgi:hypothetical protein